MVEEKVVKRYRIIDLLDMLKEIEMLEFHFNVPEDSKITFEISFTQGVLPKVLPEPRTKMTLVKKTQASNGMEYPFRIFHSTLATKGVLALLVGDAPNPG